MSDQEETKATFRIVIHSKEARAYFWDAARTLKHLQNMYLLLREDCYALSKDEEVKILSPLSASTPKDKLFKAVCSPEVMRAVLYGRPGGVKAEKVELVRQSLEGQTLLSDMKTLCEKIPAKNVYKMLKSIRAAFKSFFTKLKNGDEDARPPQARALSKSRCFSIPIDQDCLSFRKKDQIGVNACRKMIYLGHCHANLEQVAGSLDKIQSANIKVSATELSIIFNYRKTISRSGASRGPKLAGLDLGLKRLAAIFVQDEKTPSRLFCGSSWVTYNCNWNRKVAILKTKIAKIEKMIEEKSDSDDLKVALWSLKARLSRLFDKRARFFRDQTHKMARRILETLYSDGVTKVVLAPNIGQIKNSKTNKMRKKTSQQFYQVPMAALARRIEEKAGEYGIEVELTDEAYTSKTSVLSGNIPEARSIEKPEENDCQKEYKSRRAKAFQGRRVRRAHFKDGPTGKTYHADVGGAANHLAVNGPLPAKYRSWLKSHFWKLANPVIMNARDCFLDRPLVPA